MLNYYRLEQRIERAVAAQQLVGLALAIVQGGDVTYARGFGRTSVEDGGLPITPDTLFCIGSISKTLTATLVMRLVEQGRLELDRPVLSYMPDFAFSDAELGGRVTLRHVLSHTTGLPAGGKDFGPRDADALRRFVYDELSRYAFVAEPGTVHLYNNTVLVLAGYLAEVVTGTYYEQLMRELVFEPLEMRRSTFDRTVAMTYPLALAHQRDAGGTLRTRHRFTDNVSGNPAGFGICSTLDLANFAIMLLSRGSFGSTRLLAPASVAEMQTPWASRYVWGAESGYGLALYTGSYKGVRHAGHGGMLESYNCFLTLFPERQVGMVLQCNYDEGPALVQLVEGIYDELLELPGGPAEPAPVAADRSQWQRHTGAYLSVHAGSASVRVDGDTLVLERDGSSTPLEAIEGGLYLAGNTSVGFVPETAGPTRFLVIDSQPYGRFEPDASFVPDPAAWAAYAGTYAEWEIDPYPLRVRIVDRQLLLSWWNGEVVCTPLSNTRFVSSYGVIEFEPGPDGQPVLVTAGASRQYRVGAT